MDGAGTIEAAQSTDILALPSPDWLYHRLTIVGPADTITRFRLAATGPGIVPWRRDYDALTDHLVMLLIQPNQSGHRTITIADARQLAGRLRDLYWRDDQSALDHYYRQTPRCPLDLHRLVPVPDEILRLGDDAAASRCWLWGHWGTTWQLRRVRDITTSFRVNQQTTRIYDFWSADWSPWRAIATIAATWPTLAARLHPAY